MAISLLPAQSSAECIDPAQATLIVQDLLRYKLALNRERVARREVLEATVATWTEKLSLAEGLAAEVCAEKLSAQKLLAAEVQSYNEGVISRQLETIERLTKIECPRVPPPPWYKSNSFVFGSGLVVGGLLVGSGFYLTR